MTSEPLSSPPPPAPSPLVSENGDRAPPPSADSSARAPRVLPLLAIGTIVAQRYRIAETIARNDNLQRYRGVDLNSGQESPMPVVIVCQCAPTERSADPADETRAA